MYDIVQVWPDSYQERNTYLPHLHEHYNLGELVAISTVPIQVPTSLSIHADDKECKTQSMMLSESWKGNMGAHA